MSVPNFAVVIPTVSLEAVQREHGWGASIQLSGLPSEGRARVIMKRVQKLLDKDGFTLVSSDGTPLEPVAG